MNSVAASADGSRVVGGTFYHKYSPGESRRAPAQRSGGAVPSESGRFGVYCYDAAGRALWSNEFDGWQGVYWVALSANGQRAAAGGFMTNNMPQQGFVSAYNAETGSQLLFRRTQQRVNQVALSGDGAWLVSAAETVLLFRQPSSPNVSSYQQTAEFKPAGTEGAVSVAISADGNTVVYADYAGYIGLLANNAGKFELRARWKVPGDERGDFCHMLDLAPDGKCFAAGGAKGVFYFFDVAKFATTGLPTSESAASVSGAIFGVAVAGDGSLFAGVVNDGTAGYAVVVPVANGAAGPARQFATKHNPNGVALNATHGMLAVADGHSDVHQGSFYLFDLATGAQRWSCATGKMSWPIAIAANGSAVVGGSDDSNLYYFRP
ncbi:MAG: hypothetical protein H7343_04425 [Undibacterium sp.]|nr:hypothetical protein [Opitutaceae bacterium]